MNDRDIYGEIVEGFDALRNVDNVYMSEKRVHKSDKSIHELDLEAPLTVNGVPLYPKKEWVGLTDSDIAQTMHGSVEGSNMLPYQFARAIEAKLKEKNT